MRSGKMIWALLFISVGILMLLQSIFKIDLPVMRILFGLFFVYIGVKVIAGAFGHRIGVFHVDRISTATESIFSENEFQAKQSDGGVNRKFVTVFGNSVLDLSSLTAEELTQEIHIDNAFGKTLIRTNGKDPIQAKVDVAFGSVTIRGKKVGSFGELNYETGDAAKTPLKLNIDAAFGEVVVE